MATTANTPTACKDLGPATLYPSNFRERLTAVILRIWKFYDAATGDLSLGTGPVSLQRRELGRVVLGAKL